MYGGMAFLGAKQKPLSEIVFDKYDTDKSGQIDAKEFQNLCYSLGYALTQQELDLGVKLLDSDGSGQIGKDEFSAWWKKSDRWADIKLDDDGVQKRQQVADTFSDFDADKKGSIFAKDFDKFYQSLVDQKLTTKSKEKFLEDLDKNRDGKIQFPEFVEWLERQGSFGQGVKLPEANSNNKK